MSQLDAIAEEIKAALAALAAEAESKGEADAEAEADEILTDRELHFWAWHVIGGNDPAPNSHIEEKRRRFEAVAKSAAPFLEAVEALSPHEAEELFLDHRWQETLRLCLSCATQVASRKPPRPRGRKPKPDALGTATAALEAFEMVTGRAAAITVGPTTSGAGGRYLDLVSTAFRALGIRANPEHYARKAIREDRSSPSAPQKGEEG